MELKAVIEGLKRLDQTCEIDVFCNSEYIVNAFEMSWLKKWKKNGWRNSKGAAISNIDLWLELDNLTQRHNVKFFKVSGYFDDFFSRCEGLAIIESKKYNNTYIS